MTEGSYNNEWMRSRPIRSILTNTIHVGYVSKRPATSIPTNSPQLDLPTFGRLCLNQCKLLCLFVLLLIFSIITFFHLYHQCWLFLLICASFSLLNCCKTGSPFHVSTQYWLFSEILNELGYWMFMRKKFVFSKQAYNNSHICWRHTTLPQLWSRQLNFHPECSF